MGVVAPVRFTVGTSAARCPIQAPPYTVVNLSTTATVWLADNAGISPGQGTPLFPGTSFRWTRDGDLWAVSDGSADIVLSYDVTDWQPDPAAIAAAILNSGVLLIDQPMVLYDDTLNAATGYDTGVLDVSKFQSVIVAANCALLGAGNLHLLNMIYYMTSLGLVTGRLGSIAIEFSAVAPGEGGYWNATLPIMGDGFRAHTLPTATEVDLVIIGSHRPQEEIDQFLPNIGMYYNGGLTVLAGGTAVQNIQPWIGEFQIDVLIGSANPMNGSLVRLDQWNQNAGAWQTIQAQEPVVLIPNNYTASIRVPSFGAAQRLRITNATAADFVNTQVRINPVNGYGGS